MCGHFTYEVVGQRTRRKAIKKMVPQELNVILFFEYFFRVLHEACSSWLKLFRAFQLHPVFIIQTVYKRMWDRKGLWN
jgi:hypothetical protein